MPMLIADNFAEKLMNSASNREEARAFLCTAQKFNLPGYVVPHGYRLLVGPEVTQAEGDVRTISLIADEPEGSEIVYKVKLIVRFEPNCYLREKNCTQLIVWRQLAGKHSDVLQGFPKRIFSYLVQAYNIVVTDDQQSEDGKRFWLDRMSESFEMEERSVYYIDLNDLDEHKVPVFVEIANRDELMQKYLPIGWGREPSHRDKVFLISGQKL